MVTVVLRTPGDSPKQKMARAWKGGEGGMFLRATVSIPNYLREATIGGLCAEAKGSVGCTRMLKNQERAGNIRSEWAIHRGGS